MHVASGLPELDQLLGGERIGRIGRPLGIEKRRAGRRDRCLLGDRGDDAWGVSFEEHSWFDCHETVTALAGPRVSISLGPTALFRRRRGVPCSVGGHRTIPPPSPLRDPERATELPRARAGTIEELAFLLIAGNGWRLHPSERVWAEAERCLAERLVVLGRTNYGLRRIQEDVLLPLEEELAERSRNRTLSPGQVLSAAADALDDYCR